MDDDGFDPDDIPDLEEPEARPPLPPLPPATADAPPPGPVNWNLLSAADAEEQWLQLNGWVNWLRQTYGLPAAIVPPLWHRHAELIWELSALHTHWLMCFHPTRDGSAPLAWHADFTAACQRLRNWVALSGTKLDRDRPTRIVAWPGEELAEDDGEQPITDRDADFVDFAVADVQYRAAEEVRKARGGR